MGWRYASRDITTFSGRKAVGMMARKKHQRQICQQSDVDAQRRSGGDLGVRKAETRSVPVVKRRCLEGTLHLMRSNFTGPIRTLAPDEMVTIRTGFSLISSPTSRVSVRKHHMDGPTDVRGPQIRQSYRFATGLIGRPRPRSSTGCAQPMNGSGRR